MLKTSRPTVGTQKTVMTEAHTLMMKPVFAMVAMVTRPLEKTMAFGGVAIGSMKALLAASVAGRRSRPGSMPMEQASLPSTGRRTVAVATLLVTSVKKVIVSVTIS